MVRDIQRAVVLPICILSSNCERQNGPSWPWRCHHGYTVNTITCQILLLFFCLLETIEQKIAGCCFPSFAPLVVWTLCLIINLGKAILKLWQYFLTNSYHHFQVKVCLNCEFNIIVVVVSKIISAHKAAIPLARMLSTPMDRE